LGLYFGNFRLRKPEIHCADDAIQLLLIARPDNGAGYRRPMAQAPKPMGVMARSEFPRTLVFIAFSIN
jgi:hypothetical protein